MARRDRKRSNQGDGGIAKISESNTLWKKLGFTLAFIAIYRVGVYIGVPGVNTEALRSFFQSQTGNIFSTFNIMSGNALERMSVVALGVMPYISASIIFQLLTVMWGPLAQLQKEGESGRRKITQYTRYSTIALAIVQGVMISYGFLSQTTGSAEPIVDASRGIGWIMLSTLTLTAGAAFVMWLGEQITDRGVGNGISLIIFASIIAALPSALMNTFQQSGQSDMQLAQLLMIGAIVIIVTAGVVFMEQAARQIRIEYAKRQVGNKLYGVQSSHLPMRINAAGVIPPIFASSLMQFPITAGAFMPEGALKDFISTQFLGGGWLYNLLYGVMVIFFAFFYVQITFKPDDIAENLRKQGGFVPGIRPGAKTAEFLHKISYRLTCLGSIYLAVICILPIILMNRINIPFYFGGTSLLIVVGVALDTFRQIEAQRQSVKYESFLNAKKKTRSRGRS